MVGLFTSDITTLAQQDNPERGQILDIIQDLGWNYSVVILLPQMESRNLLPLRKPLSTYSCIEYLDLSVLILKFDGTNVLGWDVADRWELGENTGQFGNGTFVYIFPKEYFDAGQPAQDMLWKYLEFIKND